MEQTTQIPKNAVMDQEDQQSVGDAVKEDITERQPVVFNVQYKQCRNEDKAMTVNTTKTAVISSVSSTLDHDAKMKETVSSGSASYDESKYESDGMDDAEPTKAVGVNTEGAAAVGSAADIDTMTIFERIDQGLAAYYTHCGRSDYLDEGGNGKFLEFAKANALNEHNVEMELEYATTNSNCSLALVDIDDDFPFPPDVASKHESPTDRNNAILKVIGSCSKFGCYAVLSCCGGSKFGLYAETEMKCMKHSDGRFECDRIDRMMDALIYLSKMDIGNRDDDRNAFKQFVEETYVSLLEDYCHIFKEHGNLEELTILAQLKPEAFRSLKSCGVHNCYYSLSKVTEYGHYFRDSDYLRKMDTDPDDVSFWWDLMDSMHCHLFHLHDMGSRIKYTDGRSRSKVPEEETWKEQNARTQSMMKRDDSNFHFERYCHFGHLGVYIFAQPHNEARNK